MPAALLLLLGAAAGAGTVSSEIALSVEPAREEQLLASGERQITGLGDATAVGTLYLTPLQIDERPDALAPYLQRASLARLALSAGVTRDGGQRFGATATARGYLRPSLGLFGGVGGAGIVGPAASSASLPAAFGLLMRSGDLELGVGAEAELRISPQVALDLRATIEARGVFVNHIEVAVSGAFGRRELAGLLRVGYFPGRAVGLLCGIEGGALDWPRVVGGAFEWPLRAPAASLAEATHLGFFVGATRWFGPALAISAAYAPTWSADGQNGLFDQRVVLTVGARR